MVEIVVPWSGYCPHRMAALRWVQCRYLHAHHAWRLTIAETPAGRGWCKAAAVNPAVRSSEADVIVLADADVWCDGLQAAVDAIIAGATWAVPHDQVHRLSQTGTSELLAGGSWTDRDLDQRPYRGIEGGGVLVARRGTLLEVPLDPRFIEWGQEDEAHAVALNTLAGPAWRGVEPLAHLWHPPMARMTRRRGNPNGWQLYKRYLRARDDPAAMSALLQEAPHDTRRPAEPAGDDRPAHHVR